MADDAKGWLFTHHMPVDPDHGEMVQVSYTMPSSATAEELQAKIKLASDVLWHQAVDCNERKIRMTENGITSMEQAIADAEKAGKRIDSGRLKGEVKSLETRRVKLEADRAMMQRALNGHLTEQ